MIINSNICPHRAIYDNHLSRSHPVPICLPEFLHFLGTEETMIIISGTLKADQIIQVVVHGLYLRMAAVATHK